MNGIIERKGFENCLFTKDGYFINKFNNYCLGNIRDKYLFLKRNGKDYPIHRLIYEAFNGDIPEGYIIHHINHNQLDNRLTNLQMMTIEKKD